MKPVTLKFVPKVAAPKQIVRYGALTTVDGAFPEDDLEIPDVGLRYPRRRSAWHPTTSERQDDAVNPLEPDDNFIYAPHHGFCVSFRPGSWTEDLFPVMTYRVWIRVSFRGSVRAQPDDIYSSLKNRYQQMNYAGPQLML